MLPSTTLIDSAVYTAIHSPKRLQRGYSPLLQLHSYTASNGLNKVLLIFWSKTAVNNSLMLSLMILEHF